jgi:methylthioribose-1-phosphate isomerase
LTAWELAQDGIEVKVAPDNMAASLMAQGRIDAVVVGSDRIAANGDVANKIGTYQVALAAKVHGVPFYVAAPVSTIDPDCQSGDLIPIEERTPREVTHYMGRRITPQGVEVLNQAFDVTPAKYVKAIITERGVAKPPNKKTIKALLY